MFFIILNSTTSGHLQVYQRGHHMGQAQKVSLDFPE